MRVVFVAIAVLATGCRQSSSDRDFDWSAPAAGTDDRGDLCVDVRDRRACFGSSECGDQGCAVARKLPARPAPKGGWRCAGTGPQRTCVPRARGAGTFACESNGTCTQRRPRYPDDGEWECLDSGGAVICRGGVSASGAVSGPPDPGWLCGSGTKSLYGERVCVDFSPDLPDDEKSWACRYEVAGDERRVCVPSTGTALGRSCDAQSTCPAGSVCVTGTCLPPRPRPSCYFDSDCSSKKCAFGSCVGG